MKRLVLLIVTIVIAMMSIVQNAAAESVYSVAGNSVEVFGALWDEKNSDTEMKLCEDGLYKWEATNLTFLDATRIEFKIVENHSWGTCFPEENYVIDIANAGIYNITFTFNEATKVVGAIVERTDVVQDSSVFVLTGTFNNWIVSQEFEMEETEDGHFRYVLDNLELDENQVVELKVVDMADFNNLKWYPEEDNITFVAPQAGGYDLTINFESDNKGVSVDGLFKVGINTYTVTWVNIMEWSEVYAFAWSWSNRIMAGRSYLGEYPGTRLEKTGTKIIEGIEYEVYTCTIRAAFAPQNIIFNNGYPGDGNQTTDLDFVDGKEYMELTPPIEIAMNEYGFMPFSSKYGLHLGYASGVKAYYAAGVDEEGRVVMEAYNGKWPARYGVILVGSPNTTAVIPTTFAIFDYPKDNMLAESVYETNVEVSNDSLYHYVFQVHNSVCGFYCVDKENVISEAGSAFLESKVKLKTDENGKVELTFSDGTVLSDDKKCATPSIAFVDGQLKFNCTTESVNFVSEVKVADAKTYYDEEISLNQTYEVSVYATRDGYADSDLAKATIKWSKGRPEVEGFSSVTMTVDESVADVNGDGAVGIGDIVSITNVMAGMK